MKCTVGVRIAGTKLNGPPKSFSCEKASGGRIFLAKTMFYCSREELETFAVMLQREFCAYDGKEPHSPPKSCDCKYGADNSSFGGLSEKGNGCPEMRCLVKILQSISSAEYGNLMERVAQEVE